ncbi:MAG: serine--tRNA ligase [Parcubacteria group bacterium RIFCSPLOWO2_01_FULL_48_18]|nr:MAG: serine--tRNA ligase [Parcubacteria group bacterium RIFCSPHIGHO2_02_FULL_48_10b]OHB23410.1 MAG: serine--tRNA ligase [Parcubacteria group bacterium RIFCSPLOWO2_01_FULL_48_18]
MLDINLIRKSPGEVKAGIKKKNADPALVDQFLELDEGWRHKISWLDALRSKQNKITADIKGGKGNREKLIEESKKIKLEIQREEATEADVKRLELERVSALRLIPNLPLEGVPEGKDETGNVMLREVGKKPAFDFEPKDYLTIGEKLGIIDVERAAKVSGSRFGYLKGEAALLEFALVNFAVKFLTNPKNTGGKPFVPVIPPVLVREEAMEGMGYAERGRDEIYHFEKDKMYLVGTSEQSIGPMHSGEVFNEADLPVRYLGFSTCFRREAGSYGKDTKGILRVHQFDKLEMFSITRPEDSRKEHEFLLEMEEELMQALKIPYHVLHICTADLGDPAAAKYDIEAWLPGQNSGRGEHRETHSTSNTTDYQSRRLNIKFRRYGSEKLEYVHMLNGTAFAIGRMIIAIMENYQTKDGGFKWPDALKE